MNPVIVGDLFKVLQPDRKVFCISPYMSYLTDEFVFSQMVILACCSVGLTAISVCIIPIILMMRLAIVNWTADMLFEVFSPT